MLNEKNKKWNEEKHNLGTAPENSSKRKNVLENMKMRRGKEIRLGEDKKHLRSLEKMSNLSMRTSVLILFN